MPRHSDTDIRIIPPRVKGGLVLFGAHDWGALLQQAKKNNISRARVCTHMDNRSAVQEMLIAFMKDSYVRPHRHLGKSESFYVIEGELSVIFFDENGKETDRVALSASASSNTRLSMKQRPGRMSMMIACSPHGRRQKVSPDRSTNFLQT